MELLEIEINEESFYELLIFKVSDQKGEKLNFK